MGKQLPGLLAMKRNITYPAVGMMTVSFIGKLGL